MFVSKFHNLTCKTAFCLFVCLSVRFGLNECIMSAKHQIILFKDDITRDMVLLISRSNITPKGLLNDKGSLLKV